MAQAAAAAPRRGHGWSQGQGQGFGQGLCYFLGTLRSTAMKFQGKIEVYVNFDIKFK